MNIDYGFRLAFEEAQLAFEEGEVPVGAVIVRGGRILGRGHNRMQALNDPTAHAEMLAITAACGTLSEGRLDGCDLYTTLEPCPMCAGAIVLARITRLFYAAADPRMGACGSVIDIVRDERLCRRVEVYQQTQFEKEAGELLERFFKIKREKS